MTQLEQIIELGKLGYSKDEITALIAQPAAPAQPVATPIQQTAPAQPVAPAQPATNNVDFLEALKLLGQQIAQPTVAPVQPVATPVQQPAAPVQPVATPIQQQTAPAQPVATPIQQTVSAQQPSINLTAEDLVKLTQGIAVQTAKGSIETPRSANDIILGMLDAYESTVKKEE